MEKCMEISDASLFLSSLFYDIINFQSWIISNFVGLLALGIHHWNDTNSCLQPYHCTQEVISIFYITDSNNLNETIKSNNIDQLYDI